MSARTHSTCPATGRRFSALPEEKSSTMRTRWPRATNAFAKWDPINPAPPVITQVRQGRKETALSSCKFAILLLYKIYPPLHA